MPSIFTNPDFSVFWSAFGALSQAVAIILSIVALLYTVNIFRKTLQSAHYTEIDLQYQHLLEMAMDRPHLRLPGAERSAAELMEYDAYAFMVWNFLETIYDRSRKSAPLRETWYPVMKTEKVLHGIWLNKPENRDKFKSEFLAFMESAPEMR